MRLRAAKCTVYSICCVLAFPAWAEPPEQQNPQEALDQIRNQMRAAQESREDIAQRREALIAELASLEKDYGRVAREIREIDGRAHNQQRKISELERRRQKASTAAEKHRQVISQQLRAAYGAGHDAWLHLFLERHQTSSLGRVMAYYNYLNRAPTIHLAAAEKEQAEASQAESELRAESERLNDTRESAVKRRIEFANVKKARSELLAKLNREYVSADQALSRLEDDERALQAVMAELPQPEERATATDGEVATGGEKTANAAPGRKRCPVDGKIIARFGNSKMSGKWDGMMIGAAEGTPVRAAESGRIEYADWLRGYGLLTIINHGNGLFSLYAFNQSLYKRVGATVSAGDIIATVGSSGGRDRPGIYFGLRQDGTPIDPVAWCDPSG